MEARLHPTYVRGTCILCGWTGLSRAYRPGQPSHCPRCEQLALWATTATQLAAPQQQAEPPSPGLSVASSGLGDPATP